MMLEGAVRVACAFGAGMVSLHGVAARCLGSMAMWALGPDGDCDYQKNHLVSGVYPGVIALMGAETGPP